MDSHSRHDHDQHHTAHHGGADDHLAEGSHDHGADHLHDHHHDHSAGGAHDHTHKSGLWNWLSHLVGSHSHGYEELAHDQVLQADERGIRVLKLSLVMLMATALLQVVIVVFSGSIALLADTIHNFGDALTALPLWLAFWLGRRQVNRRFTYGYGRAEDLAGVLIVLIIFFSALVALYQAYDRLIHPRTLENLGWVIAASIIGFVGNEAVAVLRIRTGRQIGSAALVADGLHARTDGLTSLGVFVGAIGVWLGFQQADPIMGALIGIVILLIVKDTAISIWHRMMDAVDPEIVAHVEHTIGHVAGVQHVEHVRARWLGHCLWLETNITVDGKLTTAESHHVAEAVRHTLFHDIPHVGEIVVHVNPWTGDKRDHHALTADHGLPSLRPLEDGN